MPRSSPWDWRRSSSCCHRSAGCWNQLQALGSQTLLPSLEAAYPWLLALIGTSLYTGFGQARRMIEGTTGRRRRIRVGMAIAAALTLLAGTAFGGAAIANEFALRDLQGPQVASRFGPTQLGAGVEPPPCDGRLVAGSDLPPDRPFLRLHRRAPHRHGRPHRSTRGFGVPLARVRRHEPRTRPARHGPARQRCVDPHTRQAVGYVPSWMT